MSKYKFGERSIGNLIGVHKDLIRVVYKALELSEIDFTVVEGLRTIERQKELVSKGLSKTMNSYHLKGKAVDLYPFYSGGVQTAAPASEWRKIAKAMKEAAKELNVTITWGGDWKSFIDMPHYQIEI